MILNFNLFFFYQSNDQGRNFYTHWVSFTVDTCTLSLCWCRVVPHKDCSHHPCTHNGDALSLVVVRV